jgi:hypothetical protein
MPEEKQYIVTWTDDGVKKYIDCGDDRKKAGSIAEELYLKKASDAYVGIIVREKIKKT